MSGASGGGHLREALVRHCGSGADKLPLASVSRRVTQHYTPACGALGNESASTFFLRASLSAFEPGLEESQEPGSIGPGLNRGVQPQPAVARQIPAANRTGQKRPG